MKFLNISEWDTKAIIQTWTRNMISNDLENAQIAAESKDVIPDELIIRNHPWVENPEEAIKMMKEQKEEAQKRQQEIFENAGGFEPHDDNDTE